MDTTHTQNGIEAEHHHIIARQGARMFTPLGDIQCDTQTSEDCRGWELPQKTPRPRWSSTRHDSADEVAQTRYPPPKALLLLPARHNQWSVFEHIQRETWP